SLLHLGDQGDLFTRHERLLETAPRAAHRLRLPPERLRGRPALRLRHLRALVSEDLVENHQAAASCVNSTSASSFSRAFLSSTTRAARETPSSRSRAAPAATNAAPALRRTMSRRGPPSPESTLRTISAFCWASPP